MITSCLHNPTIFRTDNGTEYFDITKVCIQNGIEHQKIDVYAHEQAAGGERINLTLLNKIRAMLFLAKLDKRFWAEALLATVYLYNRTPHASVKFKTSYELKYGRIPNFKNIKIWDSLTYSLINKSKKLNSRAKPTILVEYDSNLYKLLDITNDRIFWSRDVQILEGVFLNDIQKTPNNFLLDEINKSSLVNQREKYRKLPENDGKIPNPIFPNACTREGVTAKIPDYLHQYTVNNELILGDMQQDYSITAQNKILENVENSLESRDSSLSHDSITSNSEFNELNESDHVTSSNRIFSNEIVDNYSESRNSIINDYSEDELALHAKNINFDSITYLNVKNSSDSAEWDLAIKSKINDLQNQKTWILVKLLSNAHIINNKWIYKTKLNQDSTINKRKARYVAKEF